MEIQEERASFKFYGRNKPRKTNLQNGDIAYYEEEKGRLRFFRPRKRKRKKTKRESFVACCEKEFCLDYYGGNSLSIPRDHLYLVLRLISALTGFSYQEIEPKVFEFFSK